MATTGVVLKSWRLQILSVAVLLWLVSAVLLPPASRAVAPARAATDTQAAAVQTAQYDQAVAQAKLSLVRVVAIHKTTSGGGEANSRPTASVASGVVVDEEGHLLTSAKTVVGSVQLYVRTPDGRDVPGELRGYDSMTGLALIQIPPRLVPACNFAPHNSIAQGTVVVTIGHSYGKIPTRGVGAITFRYRQRSSPFFQMTNAVYPGNSGGAVIDRQGRLVGVIVGELGEVQAEAALYETGSQRGKSFAVPVDELVLLIRELREFGMVRRGYLGVRIEQGKIIDPARPDEPFEIGVSVTEVFPAGPAWKAGLRPGDLVVAVDGEPVNSPEELMAMVVGRRSGSSAQFVWVRDDIRHEAGVQLGVTPKSLAFSNVRNAPRSLVLPNDQVQRELNRLRRELDSLESYQRFPIR